MNSRSIMLYGAFVRYYGAAIGGLWNKLVLLMCNSWR